MNLIENLTKYFGFTSFRETQEKIIKGALKGYDQLVILPTGSGKSICYQLPALINDGYTIIISPLKSLIKDQITNLENKSIKSVAIYGDISMKCKNEIYSSILSNKADFKIIYTTPETLDKSIEFLNCINHMIKNNKLNRFVIDEAHCISLWGNDFRSSYRNLTSLKKYFKDIPIMALTATATLQVRKDIVHLLRFKKYRQYTKSYFRDNLNIKILYKENAKKDFKQCLDICRENVNKCGIIYCNSRKKCDTLAAELVKNDINCVSYHAGLSNKERTSREIMWKKDEVNIIVATIAFGMGIDKSDVRFVIHNNLPMSIENYYQEIGRGGRDGKVCDCILFYNYQDKIIAEKLLRRNPMYNKNEKYIEHQISKLNQMCIYCENIFDCRHCQLSNYLGEKRKYDSQKCHTSCDNCKCVSKYKSEDVSDIVKEIMKSLMLANNRSSKKNIKLIFSRSNNYSFLSNKYGGKKELSLLFNRIIIYLIINKYINESLELNNYGFWDEKLKLYKKSQLVLNDKKKVNILIRK